MNDDVNILIEHPNIAQSDLDLIFGEGEIITRLPRESTMLDVLVAVGAFPSKGQARKNWQGPVEIPMGFSDFTIGKKRRRLFIHNPPDNLQPLEYEENGEEKTY